MAPTWAGPGLFILPFGYTIERLKSYLFLGVSSLLLLQALLLDEFCVPQLLEGPLLGAQVGQLLLLHHLQQTLLQGLAHQHLQDRLHLQLEVEQLHVQKKTGFEICKYVFTLTKLLLLLALGIEVN